MNEKLEYLLKTKSYSELTEDELREFSGLCDSREEYENMQLFFSQLDNYKATQSYEPHYMTKGSLDEIFEKKHTRKGILVKLFPPNKPIYLSPLVQIAALIVVVFLIFQFSSTDSVYTPQIAIVEKPALKNKPKEEKSKATDNIPKEEINYGRQVKKNSIQHLNNVPVKKDNGSVFQPINDEMIVATNSGSTPLSEADYSSSTITTTSTTSNFLSSTPSVSYSGTFTTTEKAMVQSRARYQDNDNVEDAKQSKSKKSNSTVQPKLFDLLTAVY